jgi:hypothetical protein
LPVLQGLTHEKIRDALIVVDSKIVTEEWLESIYKTCPDPADYEAVCAFEGPESELMPSNRYVKLVGAIPRLSVRCQTIMYKLTFDALAQNLEKEKLEPIYNTLVALRKSVNVKKVVEIVLTIGNYINGGTKKGGAMAFTIETLNQLRSSKSTVNPKVNLLGFVVMIVEKSYPAADR